MLRYICYKGHDVARGRPSCSDWMFGTTGVGQVAHAGECLLGVDMETRRKDLTFKFGVWCATSGSRIIAAAAAVSLPPSPL